MDMIAVIADDFTGAAEIGGIGLRRGLKVIIEPAVTGQEDTDLLVIATNTRSMPVEGAKKEIEKVTRQLIGLSPKYIFKKLDSVLRGHIYEELISQQKASAKKRVIVIPANPHFNRIIRDGIYQINGIPLAETSFAGDPEFPVNKSNVRDIIGGGTEMVLSLNVSDQLPDEGFTIGNVIREQDLIAWAEKTDENTLVAGGSGFFEALLQKDFPEIKAAPCMNCFLGRNVLFIFGSTWPKDTETINRFREADAEILNLPEPIFHNQPDRSSVQEWSGRIADRIRVNGRVVITTVFSAADHSVPFETVRNTVALLTRKVAARVQLDDLFIEGGATAFEVLRQLGIRQLIPLRELDFGIVRMRVPGITNLYVTTKPGSYAWPDFLTTKKRC